MVRKEEHDRRWSQRRRQGTDQIESQKGAVLFLLCFLSFFFLIAASLKYNSCNIQFAIFKVHDSECVFRVIQSCPQLNFRTFSLCQKETLSPLAVTPYPSIPSSWQPLIYILSEICNYTIPSLLSLASSLSTVIAKFIHVAAWITTSSFLLLSNSPLNGYIKIRLSTQHQMNIWLVSTLGIL